MFHYVDAANEASIRRDGLLSTTTMLHRGGFAADVAAAARAFRPLGLTLPNGTWVRDQAPMPPAALAAALDPGLSPSDWYDLVNGHVFFWLDVERMRRHGAALRARAQILLTVDVPALVAAYHHAAYVTPFNVGNARRAPARRGRRTLCPLASWRAHGWKEEAPPGGRTRPSSHAPAELLIEDGVPDIDRFILRRDHVAPW